MNTPVRMIAKVVGRLSEPKVKHYYGMPPELTGGKDLRIPLDFPVLVLIEEEPEGVFLTRYTADGRDVGDTWHMTVEEAQQQAQFEFGTLLSNWKTIPSDVDDAIAFGLAAER